MYGNLQGSLHQMRMIWKITLLIFQKVSVGIKMNKSKTILHVKNVSRYRPAKLDLHESGTIG
jgi:hypothetical protein